MKRMFLGLAALVLTVLLASCSQQASLSVSLGSTSGSVVRGDHVSIPVTVSNAAGAVTLSVSGVPSGVTASFAAPTLSAGATSTSLDVQVAAAAVEGSATLTVNAVEGSHAASATYDVTVTSLSVHGKVVGLLDAPVAGATVSIQGTSSTTAADGSFTIGGISVPYDLDVFQTITTPSTMAFAHVFQGLTTSSPTVMPVSVLGGSISHQGGTISGTLGSAVATGYKAEVCAAGVSVAVFGCATVAAGGTSFSLPVGWGTGASADVTVRALEVQTDANGVATGYGRYGTASATVPNGGSTPLTVNFGTGPTTATLAANVVVPSGYALSSFAVGASLDALSTMNLFQPTTTTVSSVVPQWAGASYDAVASAYVTGGGASIGWKTGLSGGASVTLALPTPPALLSPADGATGVGVGSTLSVASTGGGAVTFIVQKSGQELAVTTMSATATIPDLSSSGFTLASATSYSWGVVYSPTATTADGAVDGWIGSYVDALLASSGGPSPTSDGTIMSTPTRGFTTP